MTPPLLVGIGGGTGAGKTTLARALVERYAGLGVAVLDQDSYYRDRSHLDAARRASVNYDEPAAIDHDLLAEHLGRLARGEAAPKPRYSFATHIRTGACDLVAPAPLVIVEGIFALWDARVRVLLGVKVYVDTGADVRLVRRLRRDCAERGRTVESVIAQYLGSVRPMHVAHVEPTREHADLVLSGEALAGEAKRLLDRIDLELEARARRA